MADITEMQMKNYVIRLFKYKEISDKQFRNAIRNLEKLKDSDLLFYYFNMGKLHTLFGDEKTAISYLEKTIMLKPEHSSAYYNLYKCYVKLNNMKMAQDSFEKFLERNDKPVNFELVINIMNAINTIDRNFIEYIKEDYSVQYVPECGYNNLDDNEELKDIYFDVIKTFNTRDYLTCMKKLELMNTKINDISYPMEVDTLIQLVKILKNREIAHYSMCLEDEKYRDISNETYATILLHLYEQGCYSQKGLLNKIEEIIINDSYTKGELILDRISSLKDFKEYQDMIVYLRGIIREKEAFSNLEEDKQNEFVQKRKLAKTEYQKKHNDTSLDLYLALKEEYNLSICDYYIGKNMYKIGNFLKAREYFLSYLEQGGVKTEKAYMFLANIEKIKKNNSAAKHYTKLMHRVHDVFSREFEYLPEREYRIAKKRGYVDSDIDSVKNRRMRTLKMNEEDFEEYSLPTTSFYDADIDGKLIIIRDLLRSGNEEEVNKLLEQLEQECPYEELPKIKQFQKNKKIYMNQKRND